MRVVRQDGGQFELMVLVTFISSAAQALAAASDATRSHVVMRAIAGGFTNMNAIISRLRISPILLLGCLFGLTGTTARAGDVPFTEHVISITTDMANDVFATDVDGDGDIDVLSASEDNRIIWYENDGGSPPNFTERVISTRAYGARSVFATDVDGDGDIDVLSASANVDDKIAWYENNGGAPPTFTERVISTSALTASSVFATDVDGDGDIDVLSASEDDDKIAWYESNGGSPPTFTERVISTSADHAYSVFATDVDGDGDTDVLSASWGDSKVAWYESDGGSPPTFTERVISTSGGWARSVFATDVDGDGDTDVLSASQLFGIIAWHENDGGSPPSFAEHVISTNAPTALSVFAADVDGDGDSDVLSASHGDDKIAWYENDGGSPPSFTTRVISNTADAAFSVFAADLDGDGDTDVLSASFLDDKIAWYENTPSPPALPSDFEHQARKNRYISMDLSTNGSTAVAYEVKLASMKRCSGDDRRACAVDADCPNVCDLNRDIPCVDDSMCVVHECSGTGELCDPNDPGYCPQGQTCDQIDDWGTCIPMSPCVEHPDGCGTLGWVDTPFTRAAVPNNDMVGEFMANVVAEPIFRVWTEDVVHVTACEVVPVAVYEVRAVEQASGTTSSPLRIGTIRKPNPDVHYGDVVGRPYAPGVFPPPDGYTNLLDIWVYFIASQGGLPGLAPPHTTWVDLHGNEWFEQCTGDLCTIPQAILGVPDLGRIRLGFLGQTYVEIPGQENPCDCPGAVACGQACSGPICGDSNCDPGEDQCNCAVDCGTPPASETTGNTCFDGLDNDCDGTIDCADQNCTADPMCDPGDQIMQWVPVGSTDPGAVIVGNEITMSQRGGGVKVTLDLMTSGWVRELGMYQATVDPAGYSTGTGDPLRPVAYPVRPSDGAFMTLRSDFVFGGGESGSVTTSTLYYSWGAFGSAASTTDDKYAGTLILDIPPGASGTYTIGFDSDPNKTFLLSSDGTVMPAVASVPAEIIVTRTPSHQGPKNRHLSLDLSTNDSNAAAYEVTLAEMNRCQNDLRRTCVSGVPIDDPDACPGICSGNIDVQCLTDEHCGEFPPCVPSGPCVPHPDVGKVVGYIDEPYTRTASPNDDLVGQFRANVVPAPAYRVWTETIVHVTACEIVPVATYEVRVIDQLTQAKSDPLTIGTIGKPIGTHYGDVVGAVKNGQWTPPQGVVNITDVQAFQISFQGGFGGTVPAHTTWVDLHGVEHGETCTGDLCTIPQAILGVPDVSRIKWGFEGKTYVETPGQEDPCDCPGGTVESIGGASTCN